MFRPNRRVAVPATADIRGYGRAGFALSTFAGVKKKELRQHSATVLLISTRGSSSDPLMSTGDQQDGRALLLVLVEACGDKYDDGVVVMAAQDAIALNTYTGLGPFRVDWQRNNSAFLDSTGSAVPAGLQRRQFLEALRLRAHAATRDPPRAPEALAGLHSALIAKTLAPEPMLGELTTACNALTTSGVDVLTSNKTRVDVIMSATTTQGGKACKACNGRGIAEATARNTSERYPEDRGRSYGRRGGRGRGYEARGRGY